MVNVFKRAVILFLMIIIMITIFNRYCYGYNDYTWEMTLNTSSKLLEDNNILGKNNPIELQSESAILIEQHTGQILFEKNSHEKLRPASVTKLMSILLIMEQIENGKINYDTKVPCSANAAAMGGSQIWLSTAEELTVDEMLKAICVVSANDCVYAMAEFIAGSEENFVNMMNNKAKELEMNDTLFKNCHGLDVDGHLTSSYDIAIMSKELLNKYPEITKYTTIYMDALRDGKSQLVNTNKLVKNYKGCTGLKTGSTSSALYNLSASATREGLDLIVVIMRGPTSNIRFEEAQKLLNYGFTNFEYKEFAKKGDILKNIPVLKGINNDINVAFENDIGFVIPKGTENEITQVLNMQDIISAPINKGEKIGEVIYKIGDRELLKINLISNNDVRKINLFEMEAKVLWNWINLLR